MNQKLNKKQIQRRSSDNMQSSVQNQPDEEPNTTIVYAMIEYTEQRVISAAIFNNVRRSLEVCSFLDNEHYVNLESFLIQVNPKQSDGEFKIVCQLPNINSERKKILSKLEDLNTIIKDPKPYSITTISAIIEPKLRFLLKQDPKLFQKQQENKRSLVALDLLFSQLQLQKQKTNKQQFTLRLFQNSSYMKLDKACLNALNIFPKNFQKKIIATNSTLYEILNKCKTAFGARCLKRWMKQPLQSRQELQKRLNLVQYFAQNQPIKNIIQNELKRLPDMDKIFYIFYRVESGKRHKCEVSDLIKLYKIITCVHDLIQNIESKGINDEFIEKIYQSLKADYLLVEKLIKMIDKCIDMSGDRVSQFMVRAETQAGLAAIKKSMDDIQRKIKSEKHQVEQYLKGDVDIVQSTSYRYVFQSLKKGLVEKVKQADNYKFISAKQTKITFTTDQMIKLCNSLITLENQYRQEQQQILNNMFKIVAGYYPVMERLSSILSELDVIIGWSGIVSTSTQRWSKPTFTENRLIGLQMRHPCVKNCIANDIHIENNKTIILTGPNMGGKSTYIRTIGVSCYLAHIGMFVPATAFETPIIDSIICRVGASDQQVKGISTFMGEMIETACMLKTATSKSLVLIDQLGRGTSTNEGFGLSWALCKYLHTEINPYCLFATHFHEMIKIEEQVQGITNMYTACKINNQNNLEFEYRVYKGKVEKSYGIQVARMLKFPKEIIDDAESYLQVYENKEYSKKYNLNPEHEDFISGLVDEMNLELEKTHNQQGQNSIKQKYHNRIKQYVVKIRN